MWLASACVRASASPRRQALKSTAELSSTRFSKRARQEFSPPATSRVGRIGYTGEAIRVEHWVVAERQGQTAALNMLGRREPFDAVPFFWSQHYDVPINYVGHAEGWDDLVVEGDIAGKDGLVRMRRAGRTVAVASVFRDLASLEAEVSLEREVMSGSA